MNETDTVRDVADLVPVHRDTDAGAVALGAFEQLLDQLERLLPEHWTARTDCEAWDVDAMVGHLLGAAAGNASRREFVRQFVVGKRNARHHDGNALDATNALQVADHAHLDPAEKVALLRARVEPAVDGRLAMPGLLRRVEVPLDQTGDMPAGSPARLQLGRLVDVVYTRDVWLHTVDIERATGVGVDRSVGPTAALVDDLVHEWAGRHGQPVELTLTGPGGGRFRQGSGGEVLELGVLDFCRALSGRAPAEGLLATRVVF